MLSRRRNFRRRGVRYVILSLMMTMLLFAGTGCTLFDPGASLDGSTKVAYERIVNASKFEKAKSVDVLSGRCVYGDLYCYLLVTNARGTSDFEMYRIDSNGYSRTITISIYSLKESGYCLDEGYLDLDDLNKALKRHYDSPFSQFQINFMNGGENSMSGVIFIIVMVVLVIDGILSGAASNMARDKGYDKDSWFWMCFLLGPVPFIIVAAMPDRVMQEKLDRTNQLLEELLKAERENPGNASSGQQSSDLGAFLPNL